MFLGLANTIYINITEHLHYSRNDANDLHIFLLHPKSLILKVDSQISVQRRTLSSKYLIMWPRSHN